MLIEDVEKLIKQLQEEQGMTQKEARQEALKRALEDFEVERGFDRPLGGCPASSLGELEDDPTLKGGVAWEGDEKPSERKGFFRRIIDKLGKGGKYDNLEF